MDFVFDSSLIPSGPSSQLRHHDLMPGRGLVRPGAGAASGSEASRNTPSTSGAGHDRQPARPPRQESSRARRGHGRSASIDSCIGAVPSSLAPGKAKHVLASNTSNKYYPPRQGSDPQAYAASRRPDGRLKRRASLDVMRGAAGGPSLRPGQHINLAGASHQVQPDRKQTAPPLSQPMPHKRPVKGGATPSLPMPRRKASAKPGQPTAPSQIPPRKTSVATVSSASLPHRGSGRSQIRADTLRVPVDHPHLSISPRSGSYTSTFSRSPFSARSVKTPHTATSTSTASPSTRRSGSYDSDEDTDDSSDSFSTARPAISPSDLLKVPDMPRHFSARLLHLIPAQRRPGEASAIPPGSVHVPSVLLALGYLLEVFVFERQQLRATLLSPMPNIPPPLSARRTLLCQKTKVVLWRLIAEHLASLSTLLVPLLEALQSATYSRQAENAMEGARAYILKIRKVFREIVSLYAEQYAFVEGLWDQRWLKAAAAEIGGWCEILGA